MLDYKHRTFLSVVGVLAVVLAGCDSDDHAEVDSGVQEQDASSLALCSGCPTEKRDATDPSVRVHHVHLNVRDAREAIDFYAKFFDTKEVWLNDKKPAIWAAPMLLLLDEVDAPLADTLQMGLEHVGMGAMDPSAWFAEKSALGLQGDTRNGAPAQPMMVPMLPGLSPFTDPGVNGFSYVYVRGPNHERIEVWSGLRNFRHVHFMTSDIDATVRWYSDLLGVEPEVASSAETGGFGNGITLGPAGSYEDVILWWQREPPIEAFVPTDDRPLGHIAFSVTALAPMFDKVKQLGLPVVSEPAESEHGFRSFFTRGPQDVLIEFVEAGPIALD